MKFKKYSSQISIGIVGFFVALGFIFFLSVTDDVDTDQIKRESIAKGYFHKGVTDGKNGVKTMPSFSNTEPMLSKQEAEVIWTIGYKSGALQKQKQTAGQSLNEQNGVYSRKLNKVTEEQEQLLKKLPSLELQTLIREQFNKANSFSEEEVRQFQLDQEVEDW